MLIKSVSDIPDTIRSQLDDKECSAFVKAYKDAFEQTQDEDKSLLAGWGAVYRSRSVVSVKSAVSKDGGAVVAGWGLLFTDQKHLDLQDTYFDKNTELLLEYYRTAPLWYEHGQDDDFGAEPIGKRVKVELYPRGIWVEHQLNKSHPQYKRILQEIKDGKLSYSSDSLSHIVETGWDAKSGYLGNWALAGWSLVNDPAEPGLGPVTVGEFEAAMKRAAAHIKHGGDKHNRSRREVLGERKSSGLRKNVNVGDVKGSDMTEEVLKQLAKLFSTEPDAQSLGEAITEYLAQFEEPENEAVVDRQLVTVLGLDDSVSDEEILQALQKFYEDNFEVVDEAETEAEAATPGEEEAEEEKKSTRMHGDEDEMYKSHRKSARADSKGYGYFTGARSMKDVNFNRGARKPGIADVIRGHLSGNMRAIKAATKTSMSYTDNITGGYMLNRELSSEILQPLYATEVVLKAGAEQVPMDGIETLTVRKMTSGSDAYWAGQSQVVGDSQPKFGVVQLNLRELVARVRIPNRLLMNSTDLESKVKEDIIKRLRLRMDKSFLVGTGAVPTEAGNTGQEPLGVLNVSGVTSTPLATNGQKPKLSDLTQAVFRIENANVERNETWGWIMHPRTKTTFTEMVDTTGQPLLREAGWESDEAKVLMGYDYNVTTQIPTNLTVGSNSDNSLIFFGDWSYAVVGMGLDVQITVDQSRYIDERETLIQAVIMADFGVYYPEAFQILTGVRAS